MKVYLNKITGIDDAIVSMYMSKRTWTREKEQTFRDAASCVLDNRGFLRYEQNEIIDKYKEIFIDQLSKLLKWGRIHTTMLRFIDISVTVEGLHRAGQDDWDSHAKRFDNRIIRSSTRLAKYNEDEMSDFYKDKILTTDQALKALNYIIPQEITVGDKTYIKTVNGYVLKGMENDKDVLRGLYMLSIPSNFIFKCQLPEFAHVYHERNENGTANPEVKECCEEICNQLEQAIPLFNRDLLKSIRI